MRFIVERLICAPARPFFVHYSSSSGCEGGALVIWGTFSLFKPFAVSHGFGIGSDNTGSDLRQSRVPRETGSRIASASRSQLVIDYLP